MGGGREGRGCGSGSGGRARRLNRPLHDAAHDPVATLRRLVRRHVSRAWVASLVIVATASLMHAGSSVVYHLRLPLTSLICAAGAPGKAVSASAPGCSGWPCTGFDPALDLPTSFTFAAGALCCAMSSLCTAGTCRLSHHLGGRSRWPQKTSTDRNSPSCCAFATRTNSWLSQSSPTDIGPSRRRPAHPV